jgi:uncharacterized damage-inducible protein DinB
MMKWLGTMEGTLEGHRSAVGRFLGALEAVPDARWTEPAAPGKWSAPQIAEHLSLTYDGIIAELRGGPGIRVRVKGLKRIMIRLLVMPAFLREGKIPPGVQTPREAAPGPGDPDRGAVQARFTALAEEFERVMAAKMAEGRGRVTHPFFGSLSLAQGLRFIEVHIRHHTKQVPLSPGVAGNQL